MRARKKKANRSVPADWPMCPMENCWQPSAAQRGGLCRACSGWWRRVQLFTGAQLAIYVRRNKRFAGRLNSGRFVGVNGERPQVADIPRPGAATGKPRGRAA